MPKNKCGSEESRCSAYSNHKKMFFFSGVINSGTTMINDEKGNAKF